MGDDLDRFSAANALYWLLSDLGIQFKDDGLWFDFLEELNVK